MHAFIAVAGTRVDFVHTIGLITAASGAFIVD